MFIIQIPFLNLDQIYNLGIFPRWIKFRDGKYAIPHGDSCLKIEQNKDRFIMNCSDEQFFEKWYDYFDVQTDYSVLFYKVQNMCKNNIDFKAACNRANGVRVLKPDLFEVTISAIMNFDTDRINKLCEICGKKHKQSMRECGVVKWYEFPTFEEILSKRKTLNNNVFTSVKQKREVLEICETIRDVNIIMYPEKEAKRVIVNILGYHDMSQILLGNVGTTFIQIAGAKDFDRFLHYVYENEEYEDCFSLLTLYMRYNKLNKPKEVITFGNSK